MIFEIDGIRNILKNANLFVDENPKNIICKCPYCGDHPNPQKKGHFYVSKNELVPVGHCWYCGLAVPITKILFDITGDLCENIVKLDTEYKTRQVKVSDIKTRFKKLDIPELKPLDFPVKSLYIRTRTFNKLDALSIPNLIFDIKEFFKMNNIDPKSVGVNDWEENHLHERFVAFLSHNHSILYCRCAAVKGEIFTFRKIPLQVDPFNMLDYWMIDNKCTDSVEVVLTEGIFNSLGCRIFDTMELNNSCRLYASGCTFSYTELLKSVCFDFSIYRANVTILSDNDKKKYHYNKFIKECEPLINNLKVVYNSMGKDFGMYPQKAVRLF